MADTAARSSIEKQTIRKLQVRLIPFLLMMFMFNVLDRNNIGFAALTMNKELGISSAQFGLLAGMFFFGYFTFEIPSNLLLHKLGARIWIARILITWGIVASLTGLSRDLRQLETARFLLGVAEAGFFPGIVLYLTYWFPKRERARTVAMFMTGLPIMLIFAAPLSGWVLDNVHWMGLNSWRWLLLLEGIPAFTCGILTYFVLPDYPEHAKFLNDEEKEWLHQELEKERQEKKSERQMTVLQSLISPRVWYLTAIYFVFLCDYYCINFWLPLEVKGLSSHYSDTTVGLLLVIPNVLGLIAMVAVSYSSDRFLERRYHAAGVAVMAGIAMALLFTTRDPLWSILLLSVAVMGIYSFFGPFWSFPSEFLTGAAAASGIALVNSFANFGGFVGPYALGLVAQKTGSVRDGMAVMSVAMFLTALLVWLLPLLGFTRPPGQQQVQTGQLSAGH